MCRKNVSRWTRQISWAIVFTPSLMLAACGGGATPTLASLRNYSASSAMATTSGAVYLRSDTVAYPAGFLPTAGLPDAQIDLAPLSTTTDAAGQFSILGSTTPTTEPVPLRASLAGFMPTWRPWLPGDAATPVPLALYPEVVTPPRPGFVGGIVTHDVGGGLPGVYADGLFPPTFERIKNVAGANLVVFPDPAWVAAYDVATPSVTMYFSSGNHPEQVVTRPMYEDIVGQAKSRNLQFMMLLGIEGEGPLNNAFVRVSPSESAYWDAWFAAYQPFVLDRTVIARDLGVEYISLGYSLGYMWALGPTRWQKLIQAMRDVGYKGKIVNFVSSVVQWGMNPYDQTVFPAGEPNDRAQFMGLFDAIGINFYEAIAKTTPDEVLSQEQPRERMRAGLKHVLDSLSVSPVPVFVMLGNPSVHGGASSLEYIEPGLLVPSLAPFRTRDYEQQADVYQALCEVINASPTGNGRVMGLFSWGYAFRDDFSRTGVVGDSAYDKSASIRAKPSEAVFHGWMQRWSGAVTSDADRLFNWAEATYPTLFFPHTSTQTISGYNARAYSSDVYLGTLNGEIYLYGPPWGGLLDVDRMSHFMPTVTTEGF